MPSSAPPSYEERKKERKKERERERERDRDRETETERERRTDTLFIVLSPQESSQSLVIVHLPTSTILYKAKRRT